MNGHCKSILICALFLMFQSAQAQSIVTDRPDQTEASSTIKKGDLQVESGLLLGFETENETTTRQILAPTTLFRFGLFKGIELRLVNQFEMLKTAERRSQGFGDLELGTKIQIFQRENSSTEVAFISHLVLPTGGDELTNDQVGTVNKLSIAHDLSENLGLGYNLGYNYFGAGNGDLTYTLALGAGINDRVGVYIETFGEFADIENFISNFDGGFTYLLRPNVQLDFSFGTGINQKMNYLAVGFSWNTGKSSN